MNTLIYVHDPMCSWCWAFAPVWAELKQQLPKDLPIKTLLGGLAPDSNEPMSQDMQGYLRDTWRRIEQSVPGTEFNHDFWTKCQPRRSTWPACRAVCAAETMEAGSGQRMSRAIQEAYYTQAKNPSDVETLVGLAAGLGLDGEAFAALIDSEGNRAEHARQMAEAQAMGVNSYPSLVIVSGERVVGVSIDYNDVGSILERVLRELT